MRFFNCLVKLGGDPVLMQAPRLHISEHELKVLRRLHGDDSIMNLTENDEEMEVERGMHLYQLARYYNDKKMIEDLFRVSLDNFEGWLEESLIAEEQDREHRFQMAQITKAGKREATITDAAPVAAPEAGASRGADPNGGDTTRIADAAKKLEESVTASAAKGVTDKKPAVQPTVGKHQPARAVD